MGADVGACSAEHRLARAVPTSSCGTYVFLVYQSEYTLVSPVTTPSASFDKSRVEHKPGTNRATTRRGLMCMLCVACNNPLRALLLFVSATGLIDRYYLVWLAVFAVSMSFMDHRRDKPHVEQS